jgi:hypothetical protein
VVGSLDYIRYLRKYNGSFILKILNKLGVYKKKSFKKMILLPIVIVTLASCKKFIDDAVSNAGSDGWTATSMLAALYAAGYEDLEENNTPDTWAYRESVYLNDY